MSYTRILKRKVAWTLFSILIYWGNPFEVSAQQRIFTDSSITFQQDLELDSRNSYDVNNAVSKLIIRYKPTPNVYKGTGISLKGRKMTYVYKPMFSIDNKTWYYYSFMEMYPQSYGFYAMRSNSMMWTHVQFYLYNCKFDGNQMKSKYCVGLSGYGNGPCKADIPVYYKFTSNSDTMYKPNTDLVMTLPSLTGKGVYNRLEIWSYDPKDSASTICITRTLPQYVKTFAPFSADPYRGEVNVVKSLYNPKTYNTNHPYDSNYVHFVHSIVVPNLPPWASYTNSTGEPFLCYHPGDTFAKKPMYIPVNKTIGKYGIINRSIRVDSIYNPVVNGYLENPIRFNFDNNLSPTKEYAEPIVIGKPYLMSNIFSYRSMYFKDSAFDYYWENLKKSDYVIDTIYKNFYLQIRPANYKCSAKVDYTGLKVQWDTMSSNSNLNQIKVIAQDVENPNSWRLVGSFNKNVVSVKDVDAIPGVKYIYRIQLINSGGIVMEETFCFGTRNGTGHLEGKVVSKSGSGIANAVVYLKLRMETSGTILQLADTTDNSGFYEFNNLPLSSSANNYTIYPYLPGHKYSPANLDRQLTLTQSSKGGIDFVDTTVFAVEGIVRAGNSCPIEGARIYMDGKATPFVTDKFGKYSAIVETHGKHTFTAYYKPANKVYTFEPNEYTLDVRNNFKNKDFSSMDSTTVRISALTRCGMPFADSVQLRIYSIKNGNVCKSQLYSISAVNSSFRFFRLPRQKYKVEVTAIFPPNTNILNKINNPVDLDLTNDSDNIRKINYVYIGQPKVVLRELPGKVCLLGDSVLFMDQSKSYDVTVNVLEVHDEYRYHSCPVDSGLLTIYDQIADLNDPVKLKVKKGEAIYSVKPNTPNLSGDGNHPYQKNLSFAYNSNDSFKLNSETETIWSFVQGHRPRTQTFVTKTPELPFFILHDPPGSSSISYLEKETEFSQTITNGMSSEGSTEGFVNLRVGVMFPVPFTGLVFGGSIGSDISLSGGSTEDHESVVTKVRVNTESFATSSSPDYVGEDGDVVVGASLNMTYALTDVLNYDSSNCSVDRDTTLVWGENGFNTTYTYTIKHIRDELIPNLISLRDMQKNKDSAILIQTWINVWQQVVDENHKAIENASKIENKSIASGAEYRNSTSTTESSEISISYESFIQLDASLFVILGEASRFNETEFGIRKSFNWTTRNSSTTSQSSTRTIGYVILDEDDGDNFSIDVTEDTKWGTVGFRTVAGISSCPHETNTQKRFAAGISVEQPVVKNIPENGQAVYTITISDNGEGFTKLQDQNFNISVDPNSNLDGAILSIAGKVLSANSPYSIGIPWGGSISLPLVLKRGPLAYDYENIEIQVTPTCDQDAGESSFEDGLSDKIKISAHFNADCPSINLVSPYNGQIVGGDNETLLFTITGYDINNPGFNSLAFQYKGIKDRYWSTSKTISKSDLKGPLYDYAMDISSMDTGYYMCRVMTSCSQGKSYTPQISFIVNRLDYSGNHFKVFKPVTRLISTFPDDGVLNAHDEIKALYSGPVMSVSGVSVFTLKDLSNGQMVPVRQDVKDGKIQLNFDPALLSKLDGHKLEAQLINVFDTSGKTVNNKLNWQFTVLNSKCYWKSSRMKLHKSSDEVGTVQAELINEGATALDYQLTLPWWLVTDNLTGKINANSTVKINFYISKNLPKHFQTDFIQLKLTKSGKIIPLEIICDEFVRMVNMPAVNSNYKDSMIGFLQFVPYKQKASSHYSEDSGDVIFVYSGTECRGKGRIQYDPVIDKWYSSVMVFGKYEKGTVSTLSFKVWDASEGKLYNAIETTSYNKDQIGCANMPFVLNLISSPELNSSINSTNDKFESLFTLYPNPAQNSFTISSKLESGFYISIFTVNGVEVYNSFVDQGINSLTINIENLPTGIYVVKLLDGNQTYYGKLIKA